MALFLRGEIWWFEYRTRSVRIVKSTGFRKIDKRKAQAVYDAARLALTAKTPPTAMQSILASIYGAEEEKVRFPLDAVWRVYEEWMRGKARILSQHTLSVRRHTLERFVEFAAGRGAKDIADADVPLALAFVRYALDGKANKTVRNSVQNLSTIWEAVGQLRQGIHNPWKAACPDRDGSDRRRDAFTDEEAERILESCKAVGHCWYEMSVIARYTGLRYGDIATLDWESVDLKQKVLRIVPNKTRKHGVRVTIPMASEVYRVLSSIPRREEGFVFGEHGVVYGSRAKVEPSFAEALNAAGITDGYHDFHSWRHTFRSALAAAGVPDETARRMGGWTNLEMASHYDHATHLKEMRDAIEAISTRRRRGSSRKR